MSAGALPGASIRRLLHRKALASNRHRAAMGQHLELRPNELAALNVLAEHGTLTPSELGALLVLTSGGVTSLVQRLERLGHLERRPHPHDGRSWMLSADPGIIEQVSRLNAPLVAALEAEIAALSASEQETVVRFLTGVDDATERAAERLIERRDGGDDEEDPEDGHGRLAPGLWT
jgi:DNA-binding MarR family transcriptional regulator